MKKIVKFKAYGAIYTIENPTVNFKNGFSVVQTPAHIQYRDFGCWIGEKVILKGVINENYEPVIPFYDEYEDITIVDDKTILTSKTLHAGDGEQAYRYVKHYTHSLTESGFEIKESTREERETIIAGKQKTLNNNSIK